MTPGSVAAMKSFNFRKRWKYFGKSPAIVSSEKSLYRVFLDTPDLIRLHPKMKHTKPMIISAIKTRTHPKNVFWSPAFGGIGASFQLLDIQQYASGLRPTRSIRSDGESSNAGKIGLAAILNQNPIFEMASKKMKGGRA